jgi:2-(3-amino-3-carboxypropyl)histidine synthase
MKKYTFNFEEAYLLEEIQKRKPQKVLLQFPEGLKPEAPRIAMILQKLGVLPIISADPCYGACDLPLLEANQLNTELIIHFGHTEFIRETSPPTIYIEVKAKIPLKSLTKKALRYLKDYQRIGLATTVQHVQTLSTVKEILQKTGKIVFIGDAGKLKYAGQVTGCNYSNVKSIQNNVDAFLFFGGGKFHALGIAFTTEKPVVSMDPYLNKIFFIEKEARKIIRQRWTSIQQSKEAKLFGIIIGLKPGQKNLARAITAKEKLEKHGKKAILLALREFTPEALMEFPTIDAFINTACPRLSLDDAIRFQKPVLSYSETLVLLGEKDWGQLCKEGFLENDI